MHKFRLILSLSSCFWTVGLLRGAEEPLRWEIEAADKLEYDPQTGIATITNGVVVKYSGAVLSARKATLNQLTGDVVAEGDVRIERHDQRWTGEKIQYNFNTEKIIGEDFKAGQSPFFAKGDVLVADQRAGVYVLANGAVTTEDYAEPGYTIRAKTLVIVPGEYIEATHATLHLGQVPVFYFPYFRRSLKQHPNQFTFTPGYRSRFGPYLLTSYNWYWNERLDGALHLDARLTRGLGFGPDLNWHLPRFGEGTFKYYYLNDDKPGRDPNGVPIDDERQRIYFSHQATLRSNLTAKAMVRYQSDAQVIRDFFESEYRNNVQPSTFVEVNQLWPNFSVDLLAQPRVNDFFETVERLPDLKLTGFRQQIGATPLYYESDSSLGYYEREFADGSTNRPFAAFRGDTFHQVVLPWTFFNWLNVSPRVGGRFTHYEEASGPGATTTKENRGVFNTGAEISFKASRVWPGVENRFFEINGLRHIVQPSINYVFVPNPSRRPRDLPQFDYELPSTRLLPIDYPDYNAIDSIDSQNVLRFGLRNKFQTKRATGVENVINWALYTDWRLHPRSGQKTFADLYSDLDVQPFSWLTFNSETRYDLNDKDWREANHTATISPNDVWSLKIGHRYLRDDPAFGPDSGNNLITSSLFFRFNENWGVRISEHFEARDGVLEEQQYTIYRDFRSWTGALTLRIRDERDGRTDVTAAVTFSLKAFPRFKQGDDRNKPSLLFGS